MLGIRGSEYCYMKKIKPFDLVINAIFIVLYIVGAFIAVPLPAVGISISLQTLFILVAAMVLPAKSAGISVCAYVLMGIAGLPVFTRGGGLSYLATPGAGFLFGFIFMALTVGLILKIPRKLNVFHYIVAGSVGVLVQYVVAIVYYITIFSVVSGNSDVSLRFAVEILFIPFIAGDLIKVAVAAGMAPRLRKAVYGSKVRKDIN